LRRRWELIQRVPCNGAETEACKTEGILEWPW